MENILLDTDLLFCEVFTDELCKHMANETNNYYHRLQRPFRIKIVKTLIFSVHIFPKK